MSKLKVISLNIIGIVALIVVAFMLELGGLQWNKFFAPRKENVRREVFEATRSYNQAKVQELAKYKLEYEMAKDEESKTALSNVVMFRFADYDSSKLPYGLKVFLKERRGY